MESGAMKADPVYMPSKYSSQSELLTRLIADDNPAIRAALRDVLRSAGLNVVGEATSVAEAIRLLKRHSPGAMIADFRLGKSSGLELARTAAEIAPSTAVILYTSYADSATIAAARAAGVRAVVFKQASASQLLSALDEIASGRPHIDDPGPAEGPG